MAKRAKIIIGNNTSNLVLPLEKLIKVREKLKIKAKGYFWSPAYRERRWDGFVRYVSEVRGEFKTGLLDQVLECLPNYEITIEDKRARFNPIKHVTKIGQKKLRPDQLEAVKAFMDHTLAGIPFRRGIMAEATNTGKSVIAAAIIASFAKKRTAVWLINSKDLFDQALSDFEEFFPGEVGQVSSKKFEWKRINVCMVQTLGLRLKKFREYRARIAQTDILIVDEGDEMIGRKDCKDILGLTYDAPIRICLTGTALTHLGNTKDRNKPHKGSTKNQEQLMFFGPIIHRRTNKQNVDEGISARPYIRMHIGNTKTKRYDSYKEEYDGCITNNVDRNRRVLKRVTVHKKRNRLPILIVFTYRKHGKKLYRLINGRYGNKLEIRLLDGKSNNRKSVYRQFNQGKVDVLICSKIVKRGLNIGRMRALTNASGGKSESNVIQILGRALRIWKGKTKVSVDDFWDEGKYLKPHSRKRLRFYKQQEFPVREMYKMGK